MKFGFHYCTAPSLLEREKEGEARAELRTECTRVRRNESLIVVS